MINFNEFKWDYCTFTEETADELRVYKERILSDLREYKVNRFFLGVHLIELYRSRSYRLFYNNVHVSQGGNCHSDVFFGFCLETFDLDKSQVSRFMNVVDEFGDKFIGLKKEWEDYSWSALVEMLPLTPEERKPIKSDWSVRQIREYHKSLLVATSQQDEPEAESDVEKPADEYAQFKDWKRIDFCRHIVELENEIKQLRQVSEPITELSSATNEDSADTFKNVWFSVEDKLPLDDRRVLVVCLTKKGYRSFNLAYLADGVWHCQGSMAGVTHWMPLPEPETLVAELSEVI